METRSRMSRSLHTNRDFEKLEPYEGKPSRTVLRGEEGSNALDLPDPPMCSVAGKSGQIHFSARRLSSAEEVVKV